MKFYFGSAVTTVTTVMLLSLLGFVGASFVNRTGIRHWGRRSLLLLVSGLVTCCFAAARDGLDKTIQHAIDGSCAPGLFPLLSVPTIIGCIGALIIAATAIAVLFFRSQRARQLCFYLMSGGIVLKIVTIELARILT